MKDKKVMELIKLAKQQANKNFCCKHSGYTVGAALLTKKGKIYTGFNIENDGIQSICAERSTFCRSLNELNKEFICIAVVGKPQKQKEFIKTLPCGYCRQFMSEFVDKNFKIYVYYNNKIEEYSIEELLPEAFVY